MMKKVVLMLALVPTLALANSNDKLGRIEREKDACLNEEMNQNTVGINMCLDEAHQKADRLLNEVYADITRQLKKKTSGKYESDSNADSLARLVKAQRTWIAHRDADCHLEGVQFQGGSGESNIINGCHYKRTAERVKFLEEIYGVR